MQLLIVPTSACLSSLLRLLFPRSVRLPATSTSILPPERFSLLTTLPASSLERLTRSRSSVKLSTLIARLSKTMFSPTSSPTTRRARSLPLSMELMMARSLSAFLPRTRSSLLVGTCYICCVECLCRDYLGFFVFYLLMFRVYSSVAPSTVRTPVPHHLFFSTCCLFAGLEACACDTSSIPARSLARI